MASHRVWPRQTCRTENAVVYCHCTFAYKAIHKDEKVRKVRIVRTICCGNDTQNGNKRRSTADATTTHICSSLAFLACFFFQSE